MALHDYREDTEGTVDTWEVLDQQRAESPGNFIVPPGASMITELEFHIAPDYGAAGIFRVASALRLQGAALITDHKPLYFVGPAGGLTVTTDGVVIALAPPAKIPVAIRVTEGQEFEAAHKFMGEDLGDVQGLLNVVYNGPVSTPVILAAEVREDDLADATETLVPIDTDVAEGTATLNFFAPPGTSRIFAVDYAVGLDVALITRFAHQFELDGNGLNVQIKPQRWGGWCGMQGLTTVGGNGLLAAPQRRILDLPVHVGRASPIIFRAGMIEDDYGAGTVVAGLLYY
jgi:hypothetical protein